MFSWFALAMNQYSLRESCWCAKSQCFSWLSVSFQLDVSFLESAAGGSVCRSVLVVAFVAVFLW